ncbi:MAG: sugar ABC transporter permease [archaeon]|nr:sugar ABC transporter permease [archaeon]
MRSAITPYLLLLPFFGLFVLFIIAPIIYTIGISFYNSPPFAHTFFTHPAGLSNYARAISDNTFWSGYRNMGLLTLMWLPVMLVLSILIAIFLDSRRGKIGALGKIVVFLPYGVPSVIGSLMWSYMYNPVGPVPLVLSIFGLHANLLSPQNILYALLNIIVWEWVGYNVVILLAGLNSIPRTYYEVAKLDGASSLQVFRHIKLPMLAKYIIFISMLTVIGDFLLFNEPYVLNIISSVSIGFTPNLYIYYLEYGLIEFNYASAVSIVVIAISLVIAIVSVRFFFRSER